MKGGEHMQQLKAPEVFVTTEYDKFHYIEGNRPVLKSHVKYLTESIKKRNLLEYEPMVVNPKFGIIDGQHRLEAARVLGVPIYYIIGKKLDLVDVAILNHAQRSWLPKEYMDAFIAQGIEDYKVLKEFAAINHLSISNSIAFLSIGYSRYFSAPMYAFREGTWRITNLEKAWEFVRYYNELAAFTEEKTAQDRDLMRAVYWMYYILDEGIIHEDFMEQLKKYPNPIYRRLNMKDYLRTLEDIYNNGRKKPVRFI